MLVHATRIALVGSVLTLATSTAAQSASDGGSDASQIQAGQRVRVRRATAMRELPRRRAGLVFMVPEGTSMEVIQVGRWWVNVRTPNHNGYVPVVSLEPIGAPAPSSEDAGGGGTSTSSKEEKSAEAATQDAASDGASPERAAIQQVELRWKEAEVRARSAEERVATLEQEVTAVKARGKELQSHVAALQQKLATGATGGGPAAASEAKTAAHLAELKVRTAELAARLQAARKAEETAKNEATQALAREREARVLLADAQARGKSLDQLEAELDRRSQYLEARAGELERRERQAEQKWQELGSTETKDDLAAAAAGLDSGGAPQTAEERETASAALAHMGTVQALGVESGLPVAEERVLLDTPDAGAPIRVVVYQLTAADLAQKQVDLVSTSLLSEVRKLQRVSAMGMNEIRALLSMEEQRQMMGCEAEESCLAEIAGALGADFLVMGDVGNVGESRMLALKRINMITAQAAATFDRRMTGGEGEELLQAVGPAVETLFPEYPLRSGFSRGVSEEVVARWNPPPLQPWVFWSVGGGSALALAVSGALRMQANSVQGAYRDLNAQSVKEPVAGTKLINMRERALGLSTASNVAAGTSAALLVTAGVVALFTDWQEDIVFGTRVGPEPSGAVQAQVVIGGRF